MRKVDTPRQDDVPIGDVVSPPFVRLPDPSSHFAGRAGRLRALAAGHRLAPYLHFLAALAEAQHHVQGSPPEPELPAPEVLARAREFGMPPLDRNTFQIDSAAEATFHRLFSLACSVEMPPSARAALGRITATDAPGLDAMVRAVLADAIPVEALAEHVFVAAALQIHFVRLGAGLAADGLVPVGDGACPTCGGPPAASLLVGWPNAHGARFCGCALCGTLWNYVRVKCVLCGSTKGIAYHELDGGPGIVKAETCESCRGYVKILNQQKDPDVDPIADDVASLDLDLLVVEIGFRRGAVNPFLLGY
jgi:FdhE protein